MVQIYVDHEELQLLCVFGPINKGDKIGRGKIHSNFKILFNDLYRKVYVMNTFSTDTIGRI